MTNGLFRHDFFFKKCFSSDASNIGEVNKAVLRVFMQRQSLDLLLTHYEFWIREVVVVFTFVNFKYASYLHVV